MRRMLASSLLTGLFICSAQASVISLGEVDLNGQGLGAANPILTLHAAGGATTESGAVSGLTFSSLNWHSASDARILFNAAEPGGDNITIDQISFTFQKPGGGALSFSNSAALQFPSTQPGIGNAGFFLGLDVAQTAALATFLQGVPNIAAVQFGLAAALSSVAGAAETFSPVSQVPLPPAVWLFTFALVGLGVLKRRMRRTSKGNASTGTWSLQ